MNITVQQKILNNELQIVQSIVEKRVTSPILGHVLIDADKGGLTLLATDLDVWYRTSFPCVVSEEGSLLVPAKKFSEIVRSLPDLEINIKGKENFWLNVKCEESEFNLVGMPSEDFPTLPSIEFEQGYKIEQKELVDLIKHVVIAMSQEETRFFINGALMQTEEDGLILVSTDGHRLAYYKKKIDLNYDIEEKSKINVVVGKKALTELLKIIDSKSSEPVIFNVKGNFIYFYIQPRLLVARLLEASFPNYKEAIAIELDKKIIVPRMMLANAVKRVSLLANEKAKGIELLFYNNNLELRSRSVELGDAKERIACQYEGEKFKVGFNSDYLLDFLNIVDDEEIIVEFRLVNKRAVFRKSKESIHDYRYVVMPMDIGEEEETEIET